MPGVEFLLLDDVLRSVHTLARARIVDG